MAERKTPAERRATRAPLFAAALQARHAHGRAFAAPQHRAAVIVPTSTPSPQEIERGMVKRDRHLAPNKDATFTPHTIEAADGSSKT